MNSFRPNKLRSGSLLALAAAGVVGFFRIPAPSEASRNRHAPGEVVAVNPDSPLAQAAARVFHGPSCAGCHFLTGIWGHDGRALDRAANKYDADTLRRYIRNPKSVDPASLMPSQPSITDAQLDEMVNFLTGLPKTTNNASPEHH